MIFIFYLLLFKMITSSFEALKLFVSTSGLERTLTKKQTLCQKNIGQKYDTNSAKTAVSGLSTNKIRQFESFLPIKKLPDKQ